MHQRTTQTFALLALLASPAFAGPAIRTLEPGEGTIIRTAVLRSTAILLSADERLRSLAQPDAERWQVAFSEYGPEGETVPVVTITPSECGLTTNLLILTTKRVLPVTLQSAPCSLNELSDPAAPFDALVRFREPAASEVKAAPASPAPAAPVRFDASLAALVEHAARFKWVAKRGYRGPRPQLVTEDEHATYLVFPKGSFQVADLPLLFLVNEKGERELANFDVAGTTFIVRSRFNEAVLVAGGGKKRNQPHLLVRRIP